MATFIDIPKAANITADTFDKAKGYRSLVFQYGKPVLDSEWNEMQDIFLERLRAFIQTYGDFFTDDGFKIQESSSNTNNFKIGPGRAFISGVDGYLDVDLEYTAQGNDELHVRKLAWCFSPDTADPVSVPALTMPSGSYRNDLVVLDLILREIDATEDPNIKNADLGEETARRWKIVPKISVIEGVSGYPTLPNLVNEFTYYNNAGCFRIALAWLKRLDGDATITTAMVEDVRERVFTGDTIFDKYETLDHSELENILGVNPADVDTDKDKHVSNNDLYTLQDQIDTLDHNTDLANMLPVIPTSTDTTRDKHISNKDLKDLVEAGYLTLEDIEEYFVKIARYERELLSVKGRLDASENAVLDLMLENFYTKQRTSLTGDFFLDIFVSEKYSNLTGISNPVEILKDTGFNNNWKEGDLGYKNGFSRSKRHKYKLEVIERYNLENVGQEYKECISRYDSINDCYWMMTQKGPNAIGEILRLSPKFAEGKVQILDRWIVAAAGSSAYWVGIEINAVNLSTNEYCLLLVLYSSNASVTPNAVFKLNISSIGNKVTLGENSKISGETIDVPATFTDIDGSDTYDFVAVTVDATASRYFCDVTLWDTEFFVLLRLDDNGSNPSINTLDFFRVEDTGAGAFDNSPTIPSDILNLEDYTFGQGIHGRSLIRSGNTLWVKVNDVEDNERYIFLINITTDIISNSIFKISGRFPCSELVDKVSINEGITITLEGDLLEIVSIGAGKFIIKRALVDVGVAENQILGEFIPEYLSTNPVACMVEQDRYYWTGDTEVNMNEVDIFRHDSQSNSYHHGRLIGVNWAGICTFAYNSETDIMYIVGKEHYYARHQIYFGSLTSLLVLMGTSYSIGNTIDLGVDWGTIASGIGGVSEDIISGLAYSLEDDLLYLVNDTDDTIDTLSADGAVWTQGVVDISNLDNTATGLGLAYKNKKLFLGKNTGTKPHNIYVLDVEKSLSSTAYLLHRLKDVSRTYSGIGLSCFDFEANALVTIHQGNKIFTKMATVEDTTVLALYSVIGTSKLLTSAVNCSSPIMKRYFSPSEFSDIENCPDKYYMVLGYADEGLSILELDHYLSGVDAISGLQRYDIRKIRAQHFKLGASNLCKFAIRNLFVEKDLIVANSVEIGTEGAVYIIDLKKDIAYLLGEDGYSGKQYIGSLTERNSSKGYAGTVNSELSLGIAPYFSIFVRTFTREDLSDYNLEYPKTFVLIGTSAGLDCLVIDWDSNNDRLPVKVWNNIFKSTTLGISDCYISPSGLVIAGEDTSLGRVFTGIIPIWELQEDEGYDCTDNSKSNEVGTNIVGKNIYGISRDSRVWKTASGLWRHQIIVSTIKGLAIVDIENEIVEWLNEEIYPNEVAIFEDNIFDLNYGYHKSRFLDGASEVSLKENWQINTDIKNRLKADSVGNLSLIFESSFGPSNSISYMDSCSVNERMVICYRDETDTLGKFDIYNKSGIKVVGPITFKAGNVYHVGCCDLENGTFVILYHDSAGNGSRFVIYDEDGSIVTSEVTVYSGLTYTNSNVDCCFSNNKLVIAWWEGNGSNIHIKFYDIDGTNPSSTHTIVSGTASNVKDISCDKVNDKVIVFYNGYNIAVAKIIELDGTVYATDTIDTVCTRELRVTSWKDKAIITYLTQSSTYVTTLHVKLFDEDITEIWSSPGITDADTYGGMYHLTATAPVINGEYLVLFYFSAFAGVGNSAVRVYDYLGSLAMPEVQFDDYDTDCDEPQKMAAASLGRSLIGWAFIKEGTPDQPTLKYFSFSHNKDIIFSPLFNNLSFSTREGMALMPLSELDESVHKSIEISLSSNPRNAKYTQGTRLLEGEKCEEIENTDNDISFVDGASASWSQTEVAKILVEDMQNESYGSGSFGDLESLKKNTGASLVEGVSQDYEYGQPLDDTGSYDIYDDKDNSDFAASRYFRVLNDDLNLTKDSALNLIPEAKNLSSIVAPPKTKFYIDPARGKLVLPRPSYFSRCEAGFAGMRDTPEIFEETPVLTAITGTESVSGKFSNGVHLFPGVGVDNSFYPFGNAAYSPTLLTMSFWLKIDNNSGEKPTFKVYLNGSSNYIHFSWTGTAWEHRLQLGGSSEDTDVTSLSGSFHHIYIVVDSAGGLATSKSVRVFIDGVEALSGTTTFSWDVLYLKFTTDVASSNPADLYIDNLKIWKEIVAEAPAWEYNSGTGREYALHEIYGSTDGYKPKDIQVGYYYLTPRDVVTLDKDGVTEGYLKWINVLECIRAGVNLKKGSDCGKCKVSLFNKTDKVEMTGDTHTSTTIDGIADTSSLAVGMLVVGTDIADNTRVATIPGPNSITLTKAAIGTTDDLDLDFYTAEINSSLIDLYSTIDEYFVFWMTLDVAKEYIIYVDHNGDKNADSSDELLKFDSCFLVTLLSSEINGLLTLYHSENTSDTFEYSIAVGILNSLVKQQAFNGNNSSTVFTLSDGNRAYEVYMFSKDGGTTWLYPEDFALSWGTNNPDYDNEQIDSNGYFSVKFDVAPILGTGNVIIKYIPKVDTAEFQQTLKHAFSGSFKDARKPLRLLDYALELTK